MYLNRLFSILKFLIAFFTAICTFLPLSSTVTIADINQYISRKKDGFVEYLFTESVDLQGKSVKFPSNAILIFKGGNIYNGEIIGDSTQINGDLNNIFNRLKISGSWKIQDISTNMFCEIDTNILANISHLSSDKRFNRITINTDCATPIKPWDSFFKIKSYTDLILNADIYSLPTSHKGGYCMDVDGEHIKINGNNHTLYGTLAHVAQKECSEWLHGLNIRINSENIFVQNINAQLFCGDGFYNAGSNVTFKSVKAKFNGRQGLSITNGKNITVDSSEFTYTGFYKICTGKGPGAGIDIEPNKDSKVSSVKILNSVAYNNYPYMNNTDNDIQIYNCYKGEIRIENSNFKNLYMGSCSDIEVHNCEYLETINYINTNTHDIFINSKSKLFEKRR